MNLKINFSGMITNNPTYHGWPTVALTADGTLLAVCSGNRENHVCPYGRVFFYRSTDGGRNWTGPEFLSQGPLDDRDAGLCIAADGSILVNYFTSLCALYAKWEHDPAWDMIKRSITLDILEKEHGYWMRRSTDGGISWSEKYRTPVNNPHGPVLLKSGRLFMPGKDLDPATATEARMAPGMSATVSDDNGVTWQILSTIPAPAGHDSAKCHELHATEAADGTILVQIRDQNGPSPVTWQTESANGGLTWSEPHSICEGFPTHLLTLKDGRLLMTYGWRKEPFGVRAMFSADGGKTWGEEWIIHDRGLNRDLGYPSTVEMPDGTFFTLWYENDGTVAHLNYSNWELV